MKNIKTNDKILLETIYNYKSNWKNWSYIFLKKKI